MDVKGKGFSKRKEQQREVFKGKQTWHMEGIGLEHNEPWRGGMRQDLGRSKGYITQGLNRLWEGVIIPMLWEAAERFYTEE